MTRLILASASPRRRQLLEMVGIPVEVRPSHIPETMGDAESPVDYSVRLARAKAGSVPGPLVLGADTIVVLDGEVLEKPADPDDALRILRKLQGRTHEVITTVALRWDVAMEHRTDVSRVRFRPADDALLRAYIATGEPMDKAGAYGIQGYGARLVERVEGDFFGVMGLPLRLVFDLLDAAGVEYDFARGLAVRRD